jgi:O-antigen/teichoic acid export membrane protein
VGASLIETFLLARFLGVTSFGVYLVLLAATELVYGFLDCRSGEAVIKFAPEFRKKHGPSGVGALMRCIMLVDVCLAVLGFTVVWVLLKYVGTWIAVPREHLDLAIILAVGFGLRVMVNSAGSYMRVSNAFPIAIQVGIAGGVIRIMLCLLAVLASPTLENVCLAVAFSEVFMGLGLFWALIRRIHADGIRLIGSLRTISKEELKEIARFMFHTNLGLTVRVIAKKADVILIAALSSSNVVALYKIAARLAATLVLFSDPLIMVIYPTLSNLHANKRYGEIKRLTQFLSGSFACAAICLIIGFAIFGRNVLAKAFGSHYEAAFPSFMIMLAGFSVTMIFFWTRALMLVRGFTMRALQAGVVAVLIQFGLLAVLVPRLGASGGAVALSAYQIAIVGFYLIALFRKNPNELRVSDINKSPSIEGIGV